MVWFVVGFVIYFWMHTVWYSVIWLLVLVCCVLVWLLGGGLLVVGFLWCLFGCVIDGLCFSDLVDSRHKCLYLVCYCGVLTSVWWLG